MNSAVVVKGKDILLNGSFQMTALPAGEMQWKTQNGGVQLEHIRERENVHFD